MSRLASNGRPVHWSGQYTDCGVSGETRGFLALLAFPLAVGGNLIAPWALLVGLAVLFAVYCQARRERAAASRE